MKLTVEISNAFYRRLADGAAAQGKTVNDYLVKIVREKFVAAASKPRKERGWRAVYGAADPKEVADLQRIIDSEFSSINDEGEPPGSMSRLFFNA